MHFGIFLLFGYSILLLFLVFAYIFTQGIYYLIPMGNYPPISQSVCTAYELSFKKQSSVYKLAVGPGH